MVSRDHRSSQNDPCFSKKGLYILLGFDQVWVTKLESRTLKRAVDGTERTVSREHGSIQNRPLLQ
jgi:hypothetical protein